MIKPLTIKNIFQAPRAPTVFDLLSRNKGSGSFYLASKQLSEAVTS